jgi:phage FluMu protein Com
MTVHIFKCERCKKKLVNFTVTYDWSKRQLHKSCWKKEQDEWNMKMMMEQYQQQQKI